MDLIEILLGGILFFIAFILIIVACEKETVIAFGAAVVITFVGAASFYHGMHGEHVKFHTKHAVMLRDLRQQGFTVGYHDVYARGGNHFEMTTEVDLKTGSCLLPFITRKLNGVWHVIVLKHDGNGEMKLTPANVARSCPS
jgi:hypothetical protein